MLDISWGEWAVVMGVGLALIGRKDLPRAAHVAGTQVGRIVGLLQGARARADRMAQTSELRQLTHEFRSGLRELDAVRSELAVSMSTSTLSPIGNMGSTQMASRRTMAPWGSAVPKAHPPPQLQLPSSSPVNGSSSSSAVSPSTPWTGNDATTSTVAPTGSTVFQTTAAVAEHEWATRGMAFVSAAEQGRGVVANYRHDQAGSVILASVLSHSLLFDQYDRVVAEQDAILQSKVTILQAKQAKQTDATTPVVSDAIHALDDSAQKTK